MQTPVPDQPDNPERSVLREAASNLRQSITQLSHTPLSADDLGSAQSAIHKAWGALHVAGKTGLCLTLEPIDQLLSMAIRQQTPLPANQLQQLISVLGNIDNYLAEVQDLGDEQSARLYNLAAPLYAWQGKPAPDFSHFVQLDRGSELQLLFELTDLNIAEKSPPTDRIALLRHGFQKNLLNIIRDNESQRSLNSIVEICSELQQSRRDTVRLQFFLAAALYNELAKRWPNIAPLERKEFSRLLAATDNSIKSELSNTPVPRNQLSAQLVYWLAQFKLDTTLPSVVEINEQFNAARQSPPQNGPAMDNIITLLHAVQQFSASWVLFANNGHNADIASRISIVAELASRIQLPLFQRLFAAIQATFAKHASFADLIVQEPLNVRLTAAIIDLELAVRAGALPLPEISQRLQNHINALTDSNESNIPTVSAINTVSSQRTELLNQLGRAMRSNFVHIEQSLDSYFRNPEHCEALADLDKYFGDVYGALILLNEDEAAELLKKSRQIVARIATNDEDLNELALQNLAQNISVLSYFAIRLGNERGNIGQIIENFNHPEIHIRFGLHSSEPIAGGLLDFAPSEELLKLTGDDTDITNAAVTSSLPEPLSGEWLDADDSMIDSELMAVFEEECQEVFATINHLQEQLKKSPDEPELLRGLRRSFHTLKGSGRMVGLNPFADRAWQFERVLEQLIDHRRPAPPVLISLIDQYRHNYTDWLHGDANVSENEAIRSELEALLSDELSSAAADSPSPSPSNQVRIGNSVISKALFDSFLLEASDRLQQIDNELELIEEDQENFDGNKLRDTCHTLAGICATAKIESMHLVARAMERLIEQTQRKTATPGISDRIQLRAANQWLRQSLDGVSHFIAPQAPDDILQRLQDGHQKTIAFESDDAVDVDLLPLFREEAEGITNELYALARNAPKEDMHHQRQYQVNRLLHTLKGSSRMVGLISFGDMVHRLEDHLSEKALAAQDVFGDAYLLSQIDLISQRLEDLDHYVSTTLTMAMPPLEDRRSSSLGGQSSITTDQVNITQLAKQVSEEGIYQQRNISGLQEMRQNLQEIGQRVLSMREHMHALEFQLQAQMPNIRFTNNRNFDPLELDEYTHAHELTKMLLEASFDINSLQKTLNHQADFLDENFRLQAKLNNHQKKYLNSLQTQPFNSISERLARVCRQTASSLNKEINLSIHHGEIEVERNALRTIGTALEHLLRNAIVHGIEPIAERLVAGKPVKGEIDISIALTGDNLEICLRDDGRGIDFERIKTVAIAKGMIAADATVDNKQLLELLFSPGFTTSESLSPLAGRGTGLDAVKHLVESLEGRIDTDTEAMQSTSFNLRIPNSKPTQLINTLVIDERLFGILTHRVDHVEQLEKDVLSDLIEHQATEYNGNRYELLLLNHRHSTQEAGLNVAVYCSVSGRQLVLLAHQVESGQRVIIKETGPQLSKIPGIDGFALTHDERIIVLINPAICLDMQRANTSITKLANVENKPTLLIVDDSLTVRRVTGRLLTRQGYQVIEARDGREAWEKMQHNAIDLVVSDIEMPHLNGFELARKIREDWRFTNIPIIVVSSRTAEKHRDQAFAIGVNHFLGKPYDENELLELIRRELQKQKERLADGG